MKKAKLKSDKGITFMICVGNYDGFYFRCSKSIWKLCLGRIALSVNFFDLEVRFVNLWRLYKHVSKY